MNVIVPELIFLASDEQIFHELQAVLSPIMFNSCQIIHLPQVFQFLSELVLILVFTTPHLQNATMPT